MDFRICFPSPSGSLASLRDFRSGPPSFDPALSALSPSSPREILNMGLRVKAGRNYSVLDGLRERRNDG